MMSNNLTEQLIQKKKSTVITKNPEKYLKICMYLTYQLPWEFYSSALNDSLGVYNRKTSRNDIYRKNI